jgi:hypothetical protein
MNKDHDAVAVIGNIIMPMIRKVTPAMMAQQIVGVQPMTSHSDGQLILGTAFLGGSKEGEWFTVSISQSIFTIKRKGEAEKENVHLKWCIATFGESYNHLTDQCVWFERDGRYYFRNEADRMMFVLRWTE